MSADELRQAAATLRERANATGPFPCAAYIQSAIRHVERNCDIDCFHGEFDETAGEWRHGECPAPDGSWDRYQTGPYIATVHPGVGLALADWLEHYASVLAAQSPIAFADDAIALARLINGGAT